MKKKGKDKKMSDVEQKAKLSVLSDLSDKASHAMGEKLMGFSVEGKNMGEVKKKADVAMDQLGKMDKESSEMKEEDESSEDEESESSYDEDEYFEGPDTGEELIDKVEDYSELDPDYLDAKIEKLLAIREKMKKGSMD